MNSAEEIPLTEDGGVIKKYLKVNENGELAPAGRKVDVLYTGRLLDGTVFDSSTNFESPFSFDLGKGSVIKGWDIAFQSMRVGEKAIIRCAPEYAYGERGAPPTIPPNSTLEFEVELLNIQEKNKWDLTPEERLGKSSSLKDEGNKAFKEGSLEDARRLYKKAIDTSIDEPETVIKDLHITLNSNMMLVLLKLGDHSKTIRYGNRLLKLDPKNVKGLFRRGQANAAEGYLEEAKKDLSKAHELDPKNNDVIKEFNKVILRLKEAKDKEKKAFQGLFQEELFEYNEPTDYSDNNNPVVFLDIAIGEESPQRIEIELFSNLVPKTAENFLKLCTGECGKGKNEKNLHFKGTNFFRLQKEKWISGGDIIDNCGTGGESIFGELFEDENFKAKHLGRGFLSMCNSGKNTNSSTFNILFKKNEYFDNKYVVFGYIRKNIEFLNKLEAVEVGNGEVPAQEIKIVDCGVSKMKLVQPN